MKVFKDISFWCIILAIVVVMVAHHVLSDKPLIEGNENEEDDNNQVEVEFNIKTATLGAGSQLPTLPSSGGQGQTVGQTVQQLPQQDAVVVAGAGAGASSFVGDSGAGASSFVGDSGAGAGAPAPAPSVVDGSGAGSGVVSLAGSGGGTVVGSTTGATVAAMDVDVDEDETTTTTMNMFEDDIEDEESTSTATPPPDPLHTLLNRIVSSIDNHSDVISRLNSASNGANSVLSGNGETRGNEDVDEDELLNIQTCPSQILSNCEILNWDVNVPQRSTVCGNAYQKVLTDDNKEKYYKCKLTPPFGSCKIDKTSEGLCKKSANQVIPDGQSGGDGS